MGASEDLLAELLAKPVGKPPKQRALADGDLTRELEVQGDRLVVSISDKVGTVTETKARSFIREEGLNPDEWEIANWYKGKYGNHELVVDDNGDPVLDAFGVQVERYSMETVKYHFKKVSQEAVRARLCVDEALAILQDHQPVAVRPAGSHGFLVLIGDMQFGKIDGDGVAGTLQRTIDCLQRAADALLMYRQIVDIGHVHVAWLGDHIEGFVSQGGANAWRTNLPLNEQIRLTRRVMLYALKLFAPLAERVSMAAVPGNHGEPVRFQGTGITRYDDSHDTEALIAVKDAADLMPEAFGHVEFYVPDTDELIVTVEVAGTIVAHSHGHKHRVGRHFEWWRGQAFARDSAMHMVDLLVEGHLHHEHIETDGTRTFIQVPSMESESTWFKHTSGTSGNPGLIVAITKDGHTPIKHAIYAKEVCK